jgi:hypothetical protein
MPPITPIHPVQAKDGRSYRRLAPAVQELMGGKAKAPFAEGREPQADIPEVGSVDTRDRAPRLIHGQQKGVSGG